MKNSGREEKMKDCLFRRRGAHRIAASERIAHIFALACHPGDLLGGNKALDRPIYSTPCRVARSFSAVNTLFEISPRPMAIGRRVFCLSGAK